MDSNTSSGSVSLHKRASDARARREHSRHRSQSKHHQYPEARTAVEYALHHLFTAWIVQADAKIKKCIAKLRESDAPVEKFCAEGVDPTFDQAIRALAYVARDKPKPLIDTIMIWRQSKTEQANEAKNQIQLAKIGPPPTLLRRNTEPAHAQDKPFPTIDGNLTGPEAVTWLDRAATISVYLVCRVLIEVYRQSTPVAITPAMITKLEDIVFTQFRVIEPEQVSASPLKMANWRIYSQLLGVMSSISFASVANRFLKELEDYQQKMSKGSVPKDLEAKAELLIMGLRHLDVKTTSGETWNATCDFMKAVSRLFEDCHGQTIKEAYCHALENLLLPIAASRESDFSAPKWKEVINILQPRVLQMQTKPRYWTNSFPLYTLIMCSSSKETFATQWLPIVAGLAPKLKDRPTRGPALQAICRLVWTYINRYPDAPNIAIRRLEDVVRYVLPPGRKTYLSTDPVYAEPLIQLIRIIGFKYHEMCFKNVVFPLINSDLFMSGKDLRIEQMEPEKMVIGIRSFLAIMSDLEVKGSTGPPFPLLFARGSIVDPQPTLLPSPKISPTAAVPTTPVQSRLSKPVDTTNLDETSRDYLLRFCEILGKITLLCDNTFGGQAALDEKFSGSTPKTPLADAFTFGKRGDDHQIPPEHKQGFYDLLHVAVQALPRCLSDHIPFNSLINLLCTGTAHVQTNIAASSAKSLKSIARQSHVQQVTIGFARFIFNFDQRYSTMSDEGMLGRDHIESTLRLYVELLEIWIEEIKLRNKASAHDTTNKGPSGKDLPLDLSGTFAHVEEIESHGLFFLCSQSRGVRNYAIKVLRLVTEFDKALGKGLDESRIIKVLENDAELVLTLNDELLSVAERSRLQKGKRKTATTNTLIELCTSEVSYDSTLWIKLFPNLIKVSYDACPFSVTLGREIVCSRLVQMYKQVVELADSRNTSQYSSMDAVARTPVRQTPSTQESLIEQWKLYLVMACTTLNNPGAQSQSQLANAQHARKSSKSGQLSQDKTSTARSLFAFVIPLLSAEVPQIRDAIVTALGSINKNLCRTLLESLQYAVTTCNEEAKQRINAHHRSPSSPPTGRSRPTDNLRTEVAHVYKLTCSFLKDPGMQDESWIFSNITQYAKELRIFLSDVEVQEDPGYQRLRFHYCGLVEELYESISRSPKNSHLMSFEARKSAFALMEDWCGHTPSRQASKLDTFMTRYTQRDTSGREENKAAAYEKEKRNLNKAALSAMASLCAGPVTVTLESKAQLSFDIRRMLNWIGDIMSTVSDKEHQIGRRALKNLIVHNKDYPHLMEKSIEMCYASGQTKALESYFEVVTQVLIEHKDYPLPFWRILALVLFTLGNEEREVRMKSAHLLKTLEARRQKSSKIQDFDISIADKTTAVYKLAQFETSKRLSQMHADLTFTIFSEFSLHFRNLKPDYQRTVVAAILPWVQSIELQLDPNGGPTARSYMLLCNLIEITIRCSSTLPNEVQALWQALATGPHGGNVQLILDFIISVCLERKEQNYINYAKQIIVFLSATPAGSKIVEFFLLQIIPRNMVSGHKEFSAVPPDTKGLPYTADLGSMLPIGNKQTGYSLGQISMIFLVDLMVAPVTLSFDNTTKLVHVVLVFWDHYTATVQEQAREMLVHLIHELVTSKIDEASTSTRQTLEDFVDSVRRNDSAVVWEYAENNGRVEEEAGSRVPLPMSYVTKQVADFFSIAHDGFSDTWAKEALRWATNCPVRHLACRSFQIYRCISISLDSSMLADMLARLSNTIAEAQEAWQTFPMEILTTLKVLISALSPSDLLRYPQLFWTTCACLSTIHEREFGESLGMLEEFLDKVDMGDPATIAKLKDAKPPNWEGDFDGVQSLIYKGLRSSASLDKTLEVLKKMAHIPNNELVGSDDRLVFTVLAQLPQFLHQFDLDEPQVSVYECAQTLADIAETQKRSQIATCLRDFAEGQCKSSKELLERIMNGIEYYFFPEEDVSCLIFVMGLLMNTLTWVRVRSMEMLCVIIPKVDLKKPDAAKHGADLISPLLRLLTTELCPQALEVMDHIKLVSGNPNERHHMRMSIASSTSRAIQKEYENTESLYGIPQATGWSIPAPAIHSATTRHNVHAVFYTCTDTEGPEDEPVPTPDVEFLADEYNDAYFTTRRTATMKSVDTAQGDANMGDLVQRLDSLDDFFDETEEVTSSFHSSIGGSMLHGSFSEMHDTGSNPYDQQAAPILSQSLARTASTSSFHNGLAEGPRPAFARNDRSVMNPTAFTSAPYSRAAASTRPSLHSRSVTSPANNLAPQTSPPSRNHLFASNANYFSDGDNDDVLSDTDDRLPITRVSPSGSTHGPTPTSAIGEGSFSIENMIRSTRSGMRRLTGGGNSAGKDKERQFLRAQHRAATQTVNSPRVPKVPAEYLTGTGSGPNSPGNI